MPLTWFVALGVQLPSCHFGPFCCEMEMRALALSVVLWWNFANVLANLVLKGPAKLQRQSYLASVPSVPVSPHTLRTEQTGQILETWRVC